MNHEKTICVYADFLSYQEKMVGSLYASETRGREFYSFEYDQEWLLHGGAFLDPDLQLYKGRQYVNDDKNIFGLFADSSPDRWGRLRAGLMFRRQQWRNSLSWEVLS